MKIISKKTFKNILLSVLMQLIIVSLVYAQKNIVSPRDSVKAIFNGKTISINYGKPSKAGRKVFGDLVKNYKVWRTGSGLATTLYTEADIELAGAIVPKGTYSLYTLPLDEKWKLIINKQVGQWGTTYNQQLDLARVDLLRKNTKEIYEYLTIKINKINEETGSINILWDNTSLSTQFHVSKDTLISSPRDSSIMILNGKSIAVDYGSPSMRGRKIMGNVVPYGKVWRTGANAATTFRTEEDIIIENKHIPKGTYTLYTIPSSKTWILIINKQTGQWGTIYNSKYDLARIALKKSILKNPIEKFKINFDKKNDTSGTLILEWEKTRLTANIKIYKK